MVWVQTNTSLEDLHCHGYNSKHVVKGMGSHELRCLRQSNSRHEREAWGMWPSWRSENIVQQEMSHCWMQQRMFTLTVSWIKDPKAAVRVKSFPIWTICVAMPKCANKLIKNHLKKKKKISLRKLVHAKNSAHSRSLKINLQFTYMRPIVKKKLWLNVWSEKVCPDNLPVIMCCIYRAGGLD